jgi:hypothetical protein
MKKCKNEKVFLAFRRTSAQGGEVMKKYIGTHLEPDEHHALGLLAAAQGVSKSAFLRGLLQQAIRMAKKIKGKEAA